ncbi:helix-turn-helix domain-containing protein [Anaerovorax odorimutans]|uniref:Helix-turn-helix domain-containing protein n=1 Tax=Anaerovorax odorimutans TaxID=109327 RepID=A0ABT1RR77_9FIRM|nr:helix-turn-helix domain-containing protein [Anaerovorax odorimutans]
MKNTNEYDFDEVTSKVNKLLGDRIKSKRKALGIKQGELASVIHKSVSSIQKYEDGSTEIPITTLLRISKYLNYPIEQIINSKDYEKIGGYFFTFANDGSRAMTSHVEFCNDQLNVHTDLSDDELNVISKLKKINSVGQSKVLNYADDLIASGKYNTDSSSTVAKIEKDAVKESAVIDKEYANMRALSND